MRKKNLSPKNSPVYIEKTILSGLLVLNRPVYHDDRGFFREIFHSNELDEVLATKFLPIQANHSRSEPGVIRALHAENWNKLVYPVSGTMFSAIVDIRPESSTFGKFATFIFHHYDRKALFIPRGFANSICVLGDEPVDYVYLVDAYYTGADTRAIAWDDPDLNIKWPIKKPVISQRDRSNPTLRQLFPDKFK